MITIDPTKPRSEVVEEITEFLSRCKNPSPFAISQIFAKRPWVEQEVLPKDLTTRLGDIPSGESISQHLPIDRRLFVPENFEKWVEIAKKDKDVHDILIDCAVQWIRAGDAPDQVNDWICDVLKGKVSRPKKSGGGNKVPYAIDLAIAVFMVMDKKYPAGGSRDFNKTEEKNAFSIVKEAAEKAGLGPLKPNTIRNCYDAYRHLKLPEGVDL